KLWSDAPVAANAVFSDMLLTAGAFSVFMLLVIVAARKFGGRRWSRALLPAAGVGVLITLLAWAVSGTGYLAVDILKHMILPIGTLTLISFAGTMLLTRNSMLETLREDFIMAARAKGLPERIVVASHAMRNAAIPVITVTGLQIGALLSGAIITESIFDWPGLGSLLLEAIYGRNYALVQGCVLVIAVSYIAVNLLADLLYGWVDPRIRQA
ncbi:MAG: ABC transporter permease, partial [SAR324 cluster bacterium]|nr:ABC transporter permease [SAR324 cluster bacterium]